MDLVFEMVFVDKLISLGICRVGFCGYCSSVCPCVSPFRLKMLCDVVRLGMVSSVRVVECLGFGSVVFLAGMNGEYVGSCM